MSSMKKCWKKKNYGQILNSYDCINLNTEERIGANYE